MPTLLTDKTLGIEYFLQLICLTPQEKLPWITFPMWLSHLWLFCKVSSSNDTQNSYTEQCITDVKLSMTEICPDSQGFWMEKEQETVNYGINY